MSKSYLFRYIVLFLISLSFCFCANEAFVEFKPVLSHSPCNKSWKNLENLCEEDIEDLSSNFSFWKDVDPEKISAEQLTTLLRTGNSIDSLSIAYFQTWANLPRSSKILEFLKDRKKLKRDSILERRKYFIAIIPGMFYKDNPITGADGAPVRNILDSQGIPNGNIQIDQVGSLEENSEQICNFIKSYNRSEHLILYSTSKGGSDFKYAISKCGNKDYFSKVKAWLNVAGLLKGTPLMTHRSDSLIKRLILRIGIPIYGYRFDSLYELRKTEDSPLSQDIESPSSMYVLNVLGIPMARHISFRGFPNYSELAVYGPNDGLTLLPDAIQSGGDVLPLWANDHYFLKFRDPSLFLGVLDWVIQNIKKK
ncbi:hypothetical protein CH362_16635 [Leptospira saintgironsiae]|uniref:Uncharacterized protein n=2 Tax=Leptospira saintgironsiae TaxID=2023183 RepID=A0A2M9Y8V7_9LEPT|nr:hypothetical protein CH362_16635 [Leptospira saintgironsiae]